MHIAISDDDSRLAAEPNGVVITSGGEARKLMMTRALYKTPPSCCGTNPPAAYRFCDEILVFAASSSGAAIGSCWRRRQYARLWHAQAQHDTDAL